MAVLLSGTGLKEGNMSFVKMEDVVKTYKMGEVVISAVDGITLIY